MHRRLLPLSLLLAFAAACGGPDDRPPNVILVTLDTTRPDYFSTYGYTPGHTPNFDALAEDGVRFDLALSASAVTPVSHASILTGKFPYRHGLRVLSAGSAFKLPRDERTLATAFKEEGYRTGAVHSAFPVSDYFGFGRDYDDFRSMEAELEEGEDKMSWDSRLVQRRSDETTDLALDFVTSGDRPFYLWLHYWDPHDPHLMPDPEYVDLAPGTVIKGPHDPAYSGFYASEVRFLDAHFGRLIAGLRDAGLYENTIIVVTADHGEGLYDGLQRHGWPKHRMTYQEQIHVPLIVRLPDGPRGRGVPDLVRTVDVAPTILDYAGLPPGDGIDGRSLRPLVEGREDGPRIAYADQVNGYDANAGMVRENPHAAFLYTVVDGGWKLTYRPHMPEASELFDLRGDALETNNVLAENRDVYLRLMADLARRNPWVVAPFPIDPTLFRTEDGARALESLGYAQGSEPSDGGAYAWVWTCPEHDEVSVPERGRHEEGGCGRILVPRAER